MDDLIATKTSEESLFLVSNASRRKVDMELMLEAQVRNLDCAYLSYS